MSNLTIGFIGCGSMLVLLGLRIPIAIALGGISFIGIWVMRGERAAFGSIGDAPYELASSWTLSAIPMFLVMGSVAAKTGMAAALFRVTRIILGRIPGNLAIATNIAAAGLASVSGSSVATTAAMARLAIPEMLKHGYAPSLASSSVAAAGTLGALIPPSVAFILYGWYAEQSVTKLFMAGIFPGLLTAALYIAMIVVRTTRTPSLAPRSDETYSRSEKLRAIAEVWPLPMVVFLVIAGIYSGAMTPTEAAAGGAAFTILVAVLQGRATPQILSEAFLESARTTAMLLLVVIGTVIFTRFLSLSGIPNFLSASLRAMDLEPWMILVAFTIVYIILGMFLEGIGVMLITLPIFIPIARENGFDLIWFGVIVVKFIEIGLLTPPVGLNAFVVKGVVGKQIELGVIFKGLLWFLAAEAIIMALLLGFPKISLYLPSLIDR